MPNIWNAKTLDKIIRITPVSPLPCTSKPVHLKTRAPIGSVHLTGLYTREPLFNFGQLSAYACTNRWDPRITTTCTLVKIQAFGRATRESPSAKLQNTGHFS